MGAFKRESRNAYFEHIQHIEQFKTEFEKLVKQSISLLGASRMVFFIDDLDRCEPRKVIEVLEAIKLFLETPETVFVLGIDDEVVQAGLKQRYGRDLADLYSSDGNDSRPLKQARQRSYHMEYLEKIIQLPFTLPAIPEDKFDLYIQKQLHLDGLEDNDQQQQIIQLFCDTCQYLSLIHI